MHKKMCIVHIFLCIQRRSIHTFFANAIQFEKTGQKPPPISRARNARGKRISGPIKSDISKSTAVFEYISE